VTINSLRNIEIEIICSMIESKENFKKITNQIDQNYFTFITVHLIYKSLLVICLFE